MPRRNYTRERRRPQRNDGPALARLIEEMQQRQAARMARGARP